MKKILTFVVAMTATIACATAQNFQYHYDLGHTLYNDLNTRPSSTATFEMFKSDKLGSTYTFIDMDFQGDGMAGAYWEVSREFNIAKNKQWAVHFEYDGGLGSDENSWQATRYQHTILAGGAWNWASADYNKTFSVQLMWRYSFSSKHYHQRAYNSVQLTEVWNTNFAKGLFSFSGFCDLWYSPNVSGKWILLSEPQLWFNLNALKGMEGVNFSFGTEVEVSNNFVFNDQGHDNRFYAIPTAAVKYTF